MLMGLQCVPQRQIIIHLFIDSWVQSICRISYSYVQHLSAAQRLLLNIQT